MGGDLTNHTHLLWVPAPVKNRLSEKMLQPSIEGYHVVHNQGKEVGDVGFNRAMRIVHIFS